MKFVKYEQFKKEVLHTIIENVSKETNEPVNTKIVVIEKGKNLLTNEFLLIDFPNSKQASSINTAQLYGLFTNKCRNDAKLCADMLLTFVKKQFEKEKCEEEFEDSMLSTASIKELLVTSEDFEALCGDFDRAV